MGDAPNIFLSCNLATAGGFDSNQYTFNLIPGLDRGYAHLPRQLADVDGDGRADYCRFVGDAPNIFLSCNLATAGGFDSNQYTFNSIPGLDRGYAHLTAPASRRRRGRAGGLLPLRGRRPQHFPVV